MRDLVTHLVAAGKLHKFMDMRGQFANKAETSLTNYGLRDINEVAVIHKLHTNQ